MKRMPMAMTMTARIRGSEMRVRIWPQLAPSSRAALI